MVYGWPKYIPLLRPNARETQRPFGNTHPLFSSPSLSLSSIPVTRSVTSSLSLCFLSRRFSFRRHIDSTAATIFDGRRRPGILSLPAWAGRIFIGLFEITAHVIPASSRASFVNGGKMTSNPRMPCMHRRSVDQARFIYVV